ncbi:MAG: nucleotide exchange factor GrpE [Parcubacteria group bacterium]|nr:nucleotide exchange factor GrpE [Parcubacteria group bacterium]
MSKNEQKKKDDIDIVETDDEGTEVNKVKKLKEKLQKCLEERKEYLDGWQRMKADSINLKKEEEKKRKELAGFVKEDMLEQLLPVLDSFELAFNNKEAWERVDENWRKGVEYIHSQLCTVLKNYGLETIEPKDMMFDPHVHTSIGTVDTKNKNMEGMVIQVIQKGYVIEGRVIRTAQVKVGKYKE